MISHSKEKYLINSVLRASNILKCFSGDKTHFKITELARRLGLDRSTTYRILLSLEKAGFVQKNEEAGTYSLGLAAFEIGNAYLMQTDLIRVSKPIMADLASKAQETVHLAVLSDIEIVYVEKVDSPRTVGVISKLGQRGPLHCTALGKTLLAFQPEDEQARIIQRIRMDPFTSKTITSKQKLIEELRIVKKQGYAVDRREIEEDVECIGAPILNHLGNVIAALSSSGPQRKIGTPREKEFIRDVVEAAATISAKMGCLLKDTKEKEVNGQFIVNKEGKMKCPGG
jgi:IclR family transcriptional regulator, KDG regulon repressor